MMTNNSLSVKHQFGTYSRKEPIPSLIRKISLPKLHVLIGYTEKATRY
jgi:hypothetical protein